MADILKQNEQLQREVARLKKEAALQKQNEALQKEIAQLKKAATLQCKSSHGPDQNDRVLVRPSQNSPHANTDRP